MSPWIGRGRGTISLSFCDVLSFALNQRSMAGELSFPSAEECDSSVTPTRHVTIPTTFIDVMQYRQVFKAALRGRCFTFCVQLYIEGPFEIHDCFCLENSPKKICVLILLVYSNLVVITRWKHVLYYKTKKTFIVVGKRAFTFSTI